MARIIERKRSTKRESPYDGNPTLQQIHNVEECTKSVNEMASFTAPASLASSLGMDFRKSCQGK